MRRPPLSLTLVLVLCAGCGTTKWTDTTRTATEQLLISDATDRSLSKLDLRALAGKAVYLDTRPMATVTDKEYVISTLRQHILATGAIIKEKLEDAEYVLEVRAGAVGTNHHDALVGLPTTTLPATAFTGGVSGTIPEIALAKRVEQTAVVKIYLFAYNRVTGSPIWQSGAVSAESKAKNVWILGAGPFQRGNIYNGTEFLGDRLKIPLVDLEDKRSRSAVPIADEAYFVEPGGNRHELAQRAVTPLPKVEPPPGNASPAAGSPPPVAPPASSPPPPSGTSGPTQDPAASGAAPLALPPIKGFTTTTPAPAAASTEKSPQQKPLLERLLR